jgi:hypothetical protein
MSLAVASREFFETFTAIPRSDWLGDLVVDDVSDLRKKVDEFEAQTSTWRATMSAKMRTAIENLRTEVEALPSDKADVAVVSAVKPALAALDEAIHAHDQPLHSDPRFVPLLGVIARESPGTAKVIRKLLRRIERLRVERRNACVDMYYALLAFETEFDADSRATQTFTSGKEASSYLRKLIA